MAGVQGTVIGGEELAKNMIVFQNKFLDEVNKDMSQVAGMLDGALTRNISMTDHSLSDLAKMGHPYSKRRPFAIHNPNYAVHKQSGEMVSGKRSGTTPASVASGKLIASAWAGILERVNHAKYIVWGTSKMVPRDFLTGSKNEVKKDALLTLSRSLKNTVINFDGRKTKL